MGKGFTLVKCCEWGCGRGSGLELSLSGKRPDARQGIMVVARWGAGFDGQ